MSDEGEGTRFTLLGGVGGIDRDGLVAQYAYPDDLNACWVRANMIASADGGATSAGKSGNLGGPGDRTVFAALRALADVIVVGGATVRIENYSGVQFGPGQRTARLQRGQAEVPPIAILTRSGVLDRDAPVLHRTEVAPLIFTSSDAAEATRRRLGDLAEVIDVSGTQSGSLDLRGVLDVLAARGLRRVLSEGGPGILGRFVDDDLLDELCLTVAPVLVGGASPRIVSGPGQVRTGMRLRHVLTDDDGFLFLRYSRAAAAR